MIGYALAAVEGDYFCDKASSVLFELVEGRCAFSVRWSASKGSAQTVNFETWGGAQKHSQEYNA